MDTIFALATAPGRAGVAVIRVSGGLAHGIAEDMARRPLPPAGRALCKLRDRHGVNLDEALVLSFLEPNSFTGENIIEFQVHGSTAVVSAVLECLAGYDGLRMAEAGEFTRRALENGRLDLTQVEGLADLIDAETEAQRRQALATLAGTLGDMADRWRRDLIRAASLIEATIDFADEDVPVDVTPEVRELLRGVWADLSGETAGVQIAERIRTGFEVAIVGPPNVGKSTLLNALAGRSAAITSEFAGTTRDVIEVRMDLGGLAVTLLDTAGLRETDDVVEGLGIQRAMERAEAADLRVVLSPAEGWTGLAKREDDIWVRPKVDLIDASASGVSGKTGQGVDDLVARITAALAQRTAVAGVATRMRHKTAMDHALRALETAMVLLDDGPERYDVAAEDIRTAIRSLESLVGRVDVENLLDEIFSSFCIGK